MVHFNKGKESLCVKRFFAFKLVGFSNQDYAARLLEAVKEGIERISWYIAKCFSGKAFMAQPSQPPAHPLARAVRCLRPPAVRHAVDHHAPLDNLCHHSIQRRWRNPG